MPRCASAWVLGSLSKPLQSLLAVLCDMSLREAVVQVRNLAKSMQVALGAGAKRILLPMSSVNDVPSVPTERSRLIRWLDGQLSKRVCCSLP